jgi:GTP cyclohydrolase I
MLEQIHAVLCFLLETPDVAVYLDCTHYCVKIRGVQNESASMHNVKLGGRFMEDPATRSEFYSLAMKGNS